MVKECDNETRFTVDELLNNHMVVHDLSKPLDDCLIKSVSTPGSHKSPFRLSALAMDLHQNMLPKDLAYYKPIKMPKNKDYLVGKFSNLLSSDNSNIMSNLHFSEFNVLSGKN